MFHCLHKGHTPLNLYFLIKEKSQQQLGTLTSDFLFICFLSFLDFLIG